LLPGYCPDRTTREDAIAILKKASSEHLAAEDGGESISGHVQNIITGDNKLAARAAWEQAKRDGFHAEIITNELQGEAREVGRELAHRLRVSISRITHPFCLIAGGETTVTITGDGKGGWNQELALTAVAELAGLKDVMFIIPGVLFHNAKILK
jgi:glycerate 2-kinase